MLKKSSYSGPCNSAISSNDTLGANCHQEKNGGLAPPSILTHSQSGVALHGCYCKDKHFTLDNDRFNVMLRLAQIQRKNFPDTYECFQNIWTRAVTDFQHLNGMRRGLPQFWKMHAYIITTKNLHLKLQSGQGQGRGKHCAAVSLCLSAYHGVWAILTVPSTIPIYIYTHTLYFASLYIAQFVPSTPLFASYPAEQVKHGYMRKPWSQMFSRHFYRAPVLPCNSPALDLSEGTKQHGVGEPSSDLPHHFLEK